MVGVEDEGWSDELEDLGEEALEELRPRAEVAVKQAAVYLEGMVKEQLTGTRTGRSYKVSRTGREHIASARGESPAVLFGNLRNSVGHEEPHWEEEGVEANVGPGLGALATQPGHVNPEAYAVRLEVGGVIDARSEQVQAHWRTISQAFGRPIPPRSVRVETHSRQMGAVRIEARPYMLPAFEKARPQIDALLEGL